MHRIRARLKYYTAMPIDAIGSGSRPRAEPRRARRESV